MSLFVGVDGGGTKTHAVVIDGARATLGSFVSGASNQNSVGQAAARTEVLAAINGALREAKKSSSDGSHHFNSIHFQKQFNTFALKTILVASICLCMSGVDRPDAASYADGLLNLRPGDAAGGASKQRAAASDINPRLRICGSEISNLCGI